MLATLVTVLGLVLLLPVPVAGFRDPRRSLPTAAHSLIKTAMHRGSMCPSTAHTTLDNKDGAKQTWARGSHTRLFAERDKEASADVSAAPESSIAATTAVTSATTASDALKSTGALTLPTVKFDFELAHENVTTVIDGEGHIIEAEYLLVKQPLPEEICERFGGIPSKIYVRQCYRELYEQAAAAMLRNCDLRSVALFTGVPGIGKSIFLVYFLYRYLSDDRFPDKRFALERVSGKYIMFKPLELAGKIVFTKVVDSAENIQPKDFLLLCDIRATAEPESIAKWTLIFSSPNPRRFKEIMKCPIRSRYTVPTWSVKELLCVNSTYDSWRDNYYTFGGVPRHVFNEEDENKVMLENAIATKGKALAYNTFSWGHGTIDGKQSYMLVHINPPVSPEGVVNYKGITQYTFASEKIAKRLADLVCTHYLTRTINVFNHGVASATFGAATAGVIFERMCLWLHPIYGKCLTATSLIDKNASKARDAANRVGRIKAKAKATTPVAATATANVSTVSALFHVPVKREILPSDWKTAGKLQPNTLYVSKSRSLESGDAFYLTPIAASDGASDGNETYQLVVLQLTVSDTHPVKANGLVTIVNAFPEAFKITDKAFVFINDARPKVDKMQNIVGKDDKVMQSVPSEARDFTQYVCAYVFSEAPPESVK